MNTNSAHVIVTNTGHLRAETTNNAKYVLCVSGDELLQILPSEESDFETSSDGKTVTDKKTGLMWQSGYEESKTWQEALAYCQSLNTGTEPYAGYTGWRLPNKNELASLLNTGKRAPLSYFPHMSESTFWSSSTIYGSGSYAWYLQFVDGVAGSFTKTQKTNVRCVRNAE